MIYRSLAICYALFDVPRLITDYKQLAPHQSATARCLMMVETYLGKGNVFTNVVLEQLVYRSKRIGSAKLLGDESSAIVGTISVESSVDDHRSTRAAENAITHQSDLSYLIAHPASRIILHLHSYVSKTNKIDL